MKDSNKINILKKRAELLQHSEEQVVLDGEEINGLQFVLSNENYAIDSLFISEVVHAKTITPIPCTPSFILGIINMRGKILSVIDLNRFFNLPEKEVSDINRLIVVKHKDIELCILTDNIVGNVIIELESLQKNVTTITDLPANYIAGVTNDGLIVLNIKELLEGDRIIINEEV